MLIQRIWNLWAKLTKVSSPAAPIVNVGDQAMVPEETFVIVLNERSVRNVNRSYKKGDLAYIKFNGSVTVVEVQASNVIVQYVQPDGANHGGTNCPNGALFALKTEDFATMNARYNAKLEMINADKAMVKNLLQQNIRGPELRVDGEGYWIDIVNPTPINNSNVEFEYGDRAVVHAGGSIQFRGSANGKALYQYISRRQAGGTKCPSGALFFVKDEAQQVA